jgi:hypothetical protein
VPCDPVQPGRLLLTFCRIVPSSVLQHVPLKRWYPTTRICCVIAQLTTVHGFFSTGKGARKYELKCLRPFLQLVLEYSGYKNYIMVLIIFSVLVFCIQAFSVFVFKSKMRGTDGWLAPSHMQACIIIYMQYHSNYVHMSESLKHVTVW